MEKRVPWLHRHWPALVTFIALVALSSWLCVERCQLLFASPYPLGIDGYYYPVQLRSIMEDGRLFYPSAPLSLWLMVPLAWLSGPIVGAKLGAAIAHAVVVFPVYILGKRLCGDRMVALLVAFTAGTSTEWSYLSLEFVKTAFGLVLALILLTGLLRALESPSRRRWAVVAALFVAVLLTHKLAFALAAVVAVPAGLIAARNSGRVSCPFTLVQSIIVAVVLVVLGLVAPGRFIGANDLGNLASLFGGSAHWCLPVADAGRGRALFLGYEVLTAAACALAAIALVIRRGRVQVLRVSDGCVIGLALFALFIAVPWLDVSDPDGLGLRIRLVAFLPLGLCGGVVVQAVIARRGETGRGLVVALCCLIWFASRPVSSRGAVAVTPDMVDAVRQVRVPKHDVVIASDRRAMYMVAWYSRANARLRPERVEPARRWWLLRASAVPELTRELVKYGLWRRGEFSDISWLGPNHAAGLLLIREATWKHIVDRMPHDVRRRYRRWRFY